MSLIFKRKNPDIHYMKKANTFTSKPEDSKRTLVKKMYKFVTSDYWGMDCRLVPIEDKDDKN